MNEVLEIAILNFLKATADDSMGLEAGDRHMLMEAHKLILVQSAETSRYREALKLIAECELGYEGMEARKVLGIPEPGESTTGSNQESWERVLGRRTP